VDSQFHQTERQPHTLLEDGYDQLNSFSTNTQKNSQTKKITVHLELVDVASGAVTLLTNPAEGNSDSEPIWSPNSDVVVFISTASGKSQLWYVPISTRQAVQMTNYPNDDISNLKWSNDGSFIAFSSS
jgi:Tol biopolymer transport system component